MRFMNPRAQDCDWETHPSGSPCKVAADGEVAGGETPRDSKRDESQNNCQHDGPADQKESTGQLFLCIGQSHLGVGNLGHEMRS